MTTTNIGVLVSGGGTNLQAILDRVADGTLARCRVAVVIASRPGVYALERAKAAGVPAVCISRKRYVDLDAFDAALVEALRAYDVDLVVTAGFLTIFGKAVVDAYPNRIINVHPALIPSFCGKGFYGLTPHKKALEYGVKLTGATTHFVDLEADAGPIILQKAVEVAPDDTPESLQKRVMIEGEWSILPESIRLFSEGRLRVEGRRVMIAESTQNT
ncbi:MAG: phosphoribosylglycinamide formyltransferase [Clostridiales bacterium]|jgi:phosphoribosylglycinamide formyltransferase-1|nr:phosphoribosylglycinamide formyltransferase [Clostridiales bacterium]